jgi:hypothetical protein
MKFGNDDPPAESVSLAILHIASTLLPITAAIPVGRLTKRIFAHRPSITDNNLAVLGMMALRNARDPEPSKRLPAFVRSASECAAHQDHKFECGAIPIGKGLIVIDLNYAALTHCHPRR